MNSKNNLKAISALVGLAIPISANATLTGWWQFDDLTDSSGNGHNVTLHGDASLGAGAFGGGLVLDGDGDWGDVASSADHQFLQGEDFTITLFFNSTDSDNNNGLVTKGYANNPRDPGGYFLLQVVGTNLFEFDSRSGAGATPRFRTGAIGPNIADGNWHNITAVRDYTANEFRSYIDGTLLHTQVLNASTGGDWGMGVNSEALTFGDHLDRFTLGSFDDIAIWRRALSPEEIALIAENGVASTIGEVAVFFTPDPASVLGGEPAILSWRVALGTTVSIDQGIGDVTAMTDANGDGSIEVTPQTTTTYILTADNGVISEDIEATVTVRLIGSLEASAGAVLAGDPVTLSWVASPAASLVIDNGIGNVDAQTEDGVGSIQITPTTGASYTLTATAFGAEETATVTVNVLVATDGPVAYWPFDEADGNIAADVSGSANEHPAELTGAIFDPAGGLFGGAVCLDGIDDEIRAPDHEDYEFEQGQDFSVTLYYNSGGIASDTNNGLITKGYGDNPRSPDGYYLLQVANSGRPEFDSRCCAGGTPRTRTGQIGVSITDGEWHNVTCVRDYGAGSYRVYVDGTLASTTTLNANNGGDWNMGVNSEDLVIGNHLNRFTTGKFDDVAIWRRVLSDDEIATIAAEGVAPLLGPGGIFQITEIVYSHGDGEASFSWPSIPGQFFVVERSPDFAFWEELDDAYPAAAPAESTTYTDDDLFGITRMFYRVTRN